MEKKIEFTQEELQTLYTACIGYGSDLYDITKKITGCSEAIHLLDNLASNCYKLAQKITGYMEDDKNA